MKNAVNDLDSNIIEVKFGALNRSKVDLDDYDLFEDDIFGDPLEDLLNEFEELNAQVSAYDEAVENHPQSKNILQRLSVADDPISMTETLIEQTGIIKTDLKKLKYYLDELSID